MDDRERLIRQALSEIEPDESEWKHFAVLAADATTCPETVIRKFLSRSPRPYPVPVESVVYTVRHLAGAKVVFLDLRPVDRLYRKIEQAFGEAGVPSAPRGFFRT
ncbi:MAG: hypothetical protein VKO64_00610 [Candidatus Sericytochromatia bacterium]|nr:hypothetical protein [Candidatus Sericytochromatia bacterium]